jgi:hypothetical protein
MVSSEESEAGLNKVQHHKQKGPKNSPEQMAASFAAQAVITKALRDAISIQRSLHREPKIENMNLADLWCIISTEKRTLKQRYIHYEFSRQFCAEMVGFNRSLHQRGPLPKAIVSKMIAKLKINDRANWKAISQRARRASVWTELAEMFQGELEYPSVVLCAVPDATHTLETLTLTDRKLYLETIRLRLQEPGNRILVNLKAASALYWAVIHNDIPEGDLAIESVNEGISFEQTVSFRD